MCMARGAGTRRNTLRPSTIFRPVPVLPRGATPVKYAALSFGIERGRRGGFEALEPLDVRSRLASREPLLDEPAKARLEDLDRQLLQTADTWLERISKVARLAEMRRRSRILPSHWWWYLDEITPAKRKAAAGQ